MPARYISAAARQYLARDTTLRTTRRRRVPFFSTGLRPRMDGLPGPPLSRQEGFCLIIFFVAKDGRCRTLACDR